jgi:integrase
MATEKGNMTDTWLKKLRSSSEVQEFLDSSCPGFRVRITPRGVKTFVYSYAHPETGLMKRVRFGSYPGMTLKDARVEWARLSDIRRIEKNDPKLKLKEEAKDREDARKAKLQEEQPVEGITINKLIQIYTRDTSSRKKSWKEEQRVLQKELGEVYGELSAYDITREQVKKIVTNKRNANKKVQANAIISHVRAMYNWAIESPEHFPRPFGINPTIGVDKKSERKQFKPAPRVRRLIEEELKTILKMFPEDHKDLLTFILLTGCRFGEATDMLWKEIQFDEWRQPADKTKNEQPHTVYLSTQAQAILKRQKKAHPSDTWVWPNPKTNSGHVRRDTVSHAINKIDFRIDHWTVHDFRRAISSWLAKSGVPREVNDRMLNHVSSGIHEVYNLETYEEPAREAWQKWGDYLDSLY